MKVIEIFYSLQGEGLDIGRPTVFIRLAGCNLDCVWCDTKYANRYGEEISIEDILNKLDSEYSNCKNVCITGGEPLLQLDEVTELLKKLLNNNYKIVLETNGSISTEPIRNIVANPFIKLAVDVKTPSSREEKSFELTNLKVIGSKDMLKFIIKDERDYDFAALFLFNNSPNCNIIFTTVGGTDLKWLAEKVVADKINVLVLPQLHKLIWGKDAREK